MLPPPLHRSSSAEERWKGTGTGLWRFGDWLACLQGQHWTHLGGRCTLSLCCFSSPVAHSVSCPTSTLSLTRKIIAAQIFTFGAEGRMLLFGFKNRTFELDYGEEHCAQTPGPGPTLDSSSCSEGALHRLSRPLSRELIPGRSVDSFRKCPSGLCLEVCSLDSPSTWGLRCHCSWLTTPPHQAARVLDLTRFPFVHSSTYLSTAYMQGP